ncbi:hypothetical protein C7293_04135 [filamentous cyanobacterium CCT1]|nr:hypothetical protein C7293_04135 [filamentous cyanobacterium CCT1]PSN80214.1 hypothetical protein C8B47_07650 [filamentous cyanobacterium CCP4]
MTTPLTTLPTPSVAGIKAIAQQHQSTLVEYSVIDAKTIYAWVISPQGDIHFETIEAKKIIDQDLVALQATYQGVRQAAPTRHAEADTSAIEAVFAELVRKVALAREGETSSCNYLKDYYRLLIQPIAQWLPAPQDRASDHPPALIFIPHRHLFTVPFAGLVNPDTNTSLVEHYTVQVAPSIQLLGLTYNRYQKLAHRQQPGLRLVVGNPTMPKVMLKPPKPSQTDSATPSKLPESQPLTPLPGAEEEAKKVAALLDTMPLLGPAARKAAVLERLPQAELVHLATHGILNEIVGLPIPGAIALTSDGTGAPYDGLLTTSELLNLNLQARLVVLSCCNTGLGIITGDGVIGLARALIAAGVPSTVVSLWPVPDQATSHLMTRFYEHRRTLNHAQALRRAMLETQDDTPDYRSWAGFILIGEA